MEGAIEAFGIYARGLIQCNQPLVFRVPHTRQTRATGNYLLADLKPEERRCFCNAVIPSSLCCGRSGMCSGWIQQEAVCKRALHTNRGAHSWHLSGFLQGVTLLVILKGVKNHLEHFVWGFAANEAARQSAGGRSLDLFLMTISALPADAQSKPRLWAKSKQPMQELTKGKGLQKQTFLCQGEMEILAKSEYSTLT